MLWSIKLRSEKATAHITPRLGGLKTDLTQEKIYIAILENSCVNMISRFNIHSLSMFTNFQKDCKLK